MGHTPARAFRAAAPALAALTMAVHLPWLSVPLNRDEGAYAFMARAALHGELPYRDQVEFKPPVLYALYLPLATLTGSHPIRFRALALAYRVAGTILLWRLGMAMLGPRPALAAGVAFALGGADPAVSGWLVSAEMLMQVAAIAAAWWWWRTLAGAPRRTAVLAGGWLGAAILIKQQAATQAALVLLGTRRTPRILFLGSTAAALAVAALGLAAAGLLPDALAAFGWAAGHLVAGVPVGTSLRQFAGMVIAAAPTQGLLWCLAAAGLARGGGSPRTMSFLRLWLAAAVAALLIGRRPYAHHLQQVLAPLALAAGLGAVRVVDARRPARWTGGIRLALAGWAVAIVVYLLPLVTAGRADQARWLYPDNPFLASESVADWVRTHTPADGAVFIAGSEPQIAWLADRRLAGRYPLMYHLAADRPGISEEQDAWLADALAAHPSAAILCDHPQSWWDPSGSAAAIGRLQARARAVLGGPGWRLAGRIPPFRLYLPR